MFSHALARGGCQHTCNGSVYYVILYGLVDPFIPFCYRYFWLKAFALDLFEIVLACCAKKVLLAGVAKSARLACLPVDLCCCYGIGYLVIFSPNYLVSL